MSQVMPPLDAEWLEADGLGGFASGTVGGARSRRYHALLLAAATPPTGRVVLVNGFDAWLETPSGSHALSSQRYAPDVVHPDGASRIAQFTWEPWPKWTFRCEDGSEVEQEIFATHGEPRVVLRWSRKRSGGRAVLAVRLFLSGRDYHSLHHENGGLRFDPAADGSRLTWRTYDGLPAIDADHDGEYTHEPHWYRGFLYSEECARGLDAVEDLASPGVLRWDLERGDAVLILRARVGTSEPPPAVPRAAVGDRAEKLRSSEFRRRRFESPLHRAADAYVVARGKGKTIVAGYPWFTDWGRDTFIALRGLAIAAGKLDVARSILLEWAEAVSEGMLPNRFSDQGESAEYNSVDASLWYVIAAHDFLAALEKPAGKKRADGAVKSIERAVDAILEGYSRGTRFGIRCDGDGLLAAGVPGVQLTWMDAKAGDWVVTPRIGKPVEVQALWLNALRIGGRFSPRWRSALEKGVASFKKRFWNAERGCLYDVVDADHVPGRTDPSVRPNQILAVGGLPYAILTGDEARKVVDLVESRLLTPLGLRSLAPGEPGYAPHYTGGPRERDGAYHQGTVWPWLLGPFVEAWVRVHGNNAQARREARGRFLAPLRRHLDEAGLGHVSEIADAEEPHTPRGCPFQAWSLGELLRLELDVLADSVT